MASHDKLDDGRPGDGTDTEILHTAEVVRSSNRGIEEVEFRIRRASIDLIGPDFTILIAAPRRSGKTTLVKTILEGLAERGWYPNVAIWTKTKSDREYAGIVPDYCIHEGLGREGTAAIVRLMDYQKMRVDAMTRSMKNDHNIFTLVVLDDVISDEYAVRNAGLFDEIFFNGRHWKIAFILLSQDIKAIPPKLRGNLDIFITFNPGEVRTMKEIVETFLPAFENVREFQQVTAPLFYSEPPDYPNRYNALWFNKAARQIPPEDRMFIGAAPPLRNPRFIMGDRELWRGCENELDAQGLYHLRFVERFPWIMSKTPGMKFNERFIYIPDPRDSRPPTGRGETANLDAAIAVARGEIRDAAAVRMP